MGIQTTRRFLLLGAGASIGAVACREAVTKTAPIAAPIEGAFPPIKMESELLGPKKGVALLSRNENPYGPAPSALKMIEYAAKKGAYYPGKAQMT